MSDIGQTKDALRIKAMEKDLLIAQKELTLRSQSLEMEKIESRKKELMKNIHITEEQLVQDRKDAADLLNASAQAAE